MDYIQEIIAASMLLIAGLMGSGGLGVVDPAPQTVEVGLAETSPLGEAGGYATPASGCSVAASHDESIHDCSTLPEIHTDKPIVRYGEDVVVGWNPYMHENCVLSQSVLLLPPTTLPTPITVSGVRTANPTAETTFSITCDGVGNFDSVTVRVLPRAQET
jgi:hypothetical protein